MNTLRPEPVRDELLTALRAAAADRPKHSTYLEALVQWHLQGCPGGEDAEPDFEDFPGVTFDVGVDLAGDVLQAFYAGSSSGVAYPRRRAAGRRAAAKRAQTMSSVEYQLSHLLG